MAQTTIGWTGTRDEAGEWHAGFTFNPWWGCVKISPACAHCYAANFAHRMGYEWGPDAPRRFFGDKHWAEPLRWNNRARKLGVRLKVFMASMADIGERLPAAHPDFNQMANDRVRAFELVERCDWLDWLILTKRPENIGDLVPPAWRNAWPANAWALTTVESQEWASRRIEALLGIPAGIRGISAEPLLGPLSFRWANWQPFAKEPGGKTNEHDGLRRLNWVITGGESQHGSRPSHPQWYRTIRDECLAAGVPFFHKQNGDWMGKRQMTPEQRELAKGKPWGTINLSGEWFPNATPWNGHDDEVHDGDHEAVMVKIGTEHTGDLLDGKQWQQFPASRGVGSEK